MRKLAFVIALFSCSVAAMAADPCTGLAGKSLSVNFNGLTGLLGPTGINLVNQNNTLNFQTTVQLTNEPPAPVTGTCKDRHIQFTRGLAPHVQSYDGWFFETDSSKMAGVFSHKGLVEYGWFAGLVPPPPPPPSCQNLCQKELQDCHQGATSPQEHMACTSVYNICKNAC